MQAQKVVSIRPRFRFAQSAVYSTTVSPLWILLCQQLLNGSFGFLVVTFADVNITDMAAFVNQVKRGPVAITVVVPGIAVVILCDGIFDSIARDGLFYVFKVCLVRELREMIPDNDESLVFILAVPFPQRGNYMLAVDSAKCPHVNCHHFAAQVSEAQRCVHVEPGCIG